MAHAISDARKCQSPLSKLNIYTIYCTVASTKIVATIGPSSFQRGALISMYGNGLSTVRINTAHITPGYIGKVAGLVSQLNSETGKHVGIMVDLKGPELRTGQFPGGQLNVVTGQQFKVGINNDGTITFSHPEIYDILTQKDLILLSDGKVRMRVVSKSEDGLVLESMDDGSLRDRSRVNVPGRFLPLGNLTDRDISYLKEGIQAKVDMFALSFVQRKEDVEELQEIIMKEGGDQFIVSKIETKNGFQNIRDIAKVSDFIMVARGDLGVELPLKEVAIAQKKIIEESHMQGVPTIVATQMLESMVKSSSPTRAEVSDVTNAIMDNTDALMLSEESSIGEYPDLAVKYLKDIAEYVESKNVHLVEPEEFLGNQVAYSIARAAKMISMEINADAILAFTKTGNTAKMLAAVRPRVPIIATVTSERLARKLNLYRGVEPLVIDGGNEDIDPVEALSYVEKETFLKRGDRVIITSGAPYFLFGGTNEVRVATVGNFVGRGYPAGKSLTGKAFTEKSGKGDILVLDTQEMPAGIKLEKLKAVIFIPNISTKLKESIREKGVTVLSNTRLSGHINPGDILHIDGSTGVITQ